VAKIMTPDPRSVSADTHATHVRSLFREGGFRSIPVVSEDKLIGILTRGDILNISSTKSNIDARGLMEHVKVIGTPDMDVAILARKIFNANEFQAPIVESDDNLSLVGIVTISDLLAYFIEIGSEPRFLTVKNIYTKKVVTCDYQDLITQVWKYMDQTGYSGIPVLKKGKLIGMITRKNIINSGNIRIHRESDEVHNSVKVEKVMRTPPVVISPQTTVDESVELLLKYDIGRLPVVKNPLYIKREPNRAKASDIIGIISREDILWSYLT
jgi:CBS domain-containing protein